MIQLEQLSNKELRKKCLEYGLPNVPVTDTSRKLFLRRLEAAMSGNPITPKKITNRRETMHVANPSEAMLPPQADSTVTAIPNRTSRRTIAATSNRIVTTTTTVSDPENSDTSPERIPHVVAAAKDSHNTSLYPKLPVEEPTPRPIQLSASKVLTTSYIQETKNPNALKNTSYAAELNASQDHFTRPRANYSTTNVPKTISYGSPIRSEVKPSNTFVSNYNVKPKSDYLIEDSEEVTDEEDVEIDRDGLETPYLSQFARNLETLKASPLDFKKPVPSMSAAGYAGSTSLPTIRNRESVYNRFGTTITPRRSLQNSTQSNDDSSVRRFLLDLDAKYNLRYSFMLISLVVFAIFFYVFFIQSI